MPADPLGRRWSALGAALTGLAVVLGAFGAHGLEGTVPPQRLDTFETGVRYHVLHGLALVVLGLLPLRSRTGIGRLMVAGIVLFSGSLYLLVLTGATILGAVTPVGGVCFIAAWTWLAVDLVRPGADGPG